MLLDQWLGWQLHLVGNDLVMGGEYQPSKGLHTRLVLHHILHRGRLHFVYPNDLVVEVRCAMAQYNPILSLT